MDGWWLDALRRSRRPGDGSGHRRAMDGDLGCEVAGRARRRVLSLQQALRDRGSRASEVRPAAPAARAVVSGPAGCLRRDGRLRSGPRRRGPARLADARALRRPRAAKPSLSRRHGAAHVRRRAVVGCGPHRRRARDPCELARTSRTEAGVAPSSRRAAEPATSKWTACGGQVPELRTRSTGSHRPVPSRADVSAADWRAASLDPSCRAASTYLDTCTRLAGCSSGLAAESSRTPMGAPRTGRRVRSRVMLAQDRSAPRHGFRRAFATVTARCRARPTSGRGVRDACSASSTDAESTGVALRQVGGSRRRRSAVWHGEAARGPAATAPSGPLGGPSWTGRPQIRRR